MTPPLTSQDLRFCIAIAREFAEADLEESANAWRYLGEKVNAELDGVHVGFTWLDVQLVAALNAAVHRDLNAPGALEKSGALYRLGVRIVAAEIAAHP